MGVSSLADSCLNIVRELANAVFELLDKRSLGGPARSLDFIPVGSNDSLEGLDLDES